MTERKPAKKAASKPARKTAKKAPVKPTPPVKRPMGPIESEVDLATGRAPWLKESDRAAIELALRLARVVDEMDDPRSAAPAFTVLARLLNDLGLTSKGRPESASPESEVTWLDELRQRKTTPTPRSRKA